MRQNVRKRGDFAAQTVAFATWHRHCFLLDRVELISRRVRNGIMFANLLMLGLFYMVLVVPVLWALRPGRLVTPF
jgi:hypothetical protein